MSLGAYEVSDDGNLLAYSTDNTGFRQYKLRVRDLRTGKDSDVIAEKWARWPGPMTTRRSFTPWKMTRPSGQYRLYRHELGAAAGKDDLVYEEKDERFTVGVGEISQRQIHFSPDRQPHHVGSAISGCVRSQRRVEAGGSAPAGRGILCRPSRRPVFDPHQRQRPQLSAWCPRR